LTSAGLALCGLGPATAWPHPLTDGQLDQLSAGGVTVGALTGAGATGLFTITGTTTTALALPGAGAADGTALAVGTNLGQAGPTPSTYTNVQTFGSAGGAPGVNSNVNFTVHGSGGVTFQGGWTFVSGG
jgi:hypothetical protein